MDTSREEEIARDLELLAVARSGFRRRLELILPDDWTNPTPCTEWSLRQLVNHVVGSDLRYADLLNGGDAEDFMRRREGETGSAPVIGDDPVKAWMDGAAAFDAALSKPGAIDYVVDYPWGPLDGRTALENRLVDIAIHTWDVARAIDADDTLDAGVVQRCLASRWFEDRPRHGGDTPLEQLLRTSGRSPTWNGRPDVVG